MKNKSALLALIVGSAVAIGVMWWSQGSKHSSLRDLGNLGTFSLKNQENQSFGLEQLKGKVSVVNFIFTNCPGVCPLLTQQMATLERNTRELGDKVQFVSVSVDPETDTPPVLKKYAEKYEVNFSRWNFLTGPLQDVERVVIAGFKTAMGKGPTQNPDDEPTMMEVTHGENFVLVDRNGTLRSFQTAKNEEELNALIKNIGVLVNEK